MAFRAVPRHDWRKTRLIAPIAALTIGALALLATIAMFLTDRFDATASLREQHVVEHGFNRLIGEQDEVVATQVQWDEAVRALDHRRDLNWADFNIGNYLATFHGFTHSFVVDGTDQAFYASVNGERAGLDQFAPFAATTRALLPAVRAAERTRPALRPRPGKNNIVVPPIQQNTFARIGGKIYIVTATLVQPDFGKIMPKGTRAPVTITALPVDAALLKSFGQRYLLDRLELDSVGAADRRAGRLELIGPDRRPVGALAWAPRQPGTMLLESLWLPLVCVLTMLCLSGWVIMRRSDSIITDLVASETRAKHLAFHDPLTRLPNRAMLFEVLRDLLGGIGTSRRHVAVLCVDLDRFKDINDTLGHHAGDLVIEKMAQRLRTVCSGAALIARLGGDEFVVLCDAGECAEPEAISQRIIAEVSKPLHCEYGQLEVGCSIGVAVIDRPGIEPTEALRWADLALYRSKERGRGQFTYFEPSMDLALRNRRSLEADLRKALLDADLRMEYQPQVDAQGRIMAVEALLRWEHPVRGDIPPGVFVPLAEETGLILQLGEYVLRRVFYETSAWHGVRVAINVSAEQMRATGFAAQVAQIAAHTGIDPSRYEIEITETALLGNEALTVANINALKRLGFSIALDDFGTGYSSLSVLQRFSVDKIKIDRSFVSCLEDGGESEALVDAMVKLARALDLKVIAEGVESSAQRDRLAACGCTEFQGFLTGRPMAVEIVDQLIGVNGSAAAPVLRQTG